MPRRPQARPYSPRLEELEPREVPAVLQPDPPNGSWGWDDPKAWSSDPDSKYYPGKDQDSIDDVTIPYEVAEVAIDLRGRTWEIDDLTITPGTSVRFRNGNLRVGSLTANDRAVSLSEAGIVIGQDRQPSPNTILAVDAGELFLEEVDLSGVTVVVDGSEPAEPFAPGAYLGSTTVRRLVVRENGVVDGSAYVGGPTGGVTATGGVENEGQIFGTFLSAPQLLNYGTLTLDRGGDVGLLANRGGTIQLFSGLTVTAGAFESEDAAQLTWVFPLPQAFPAPLLAVAGHAQFAGGFGFDIASRVDFDLPVGPSAYPVITYASFSGRFRDPDLSGFVDLVERVRNFDGPDFRGPPGLDYDPTRIAVSILRPFVEIDGYPPESDFADGADGLIIVFGGATGEPDPEFAKNMTQSAIGKWPTLIVNWTGFTNGFNVEVSTSPIDPLRESARNGYDLGRSLASWMAVSGLTRFPRYHVLGYSMGVWPADGLADALSDMGVAGQGGTAPLHLTLIDGFVPAARTGSGPFPASPMPGRTVGAVEELGESATWAEHYVGDDLLTGFLTDYTDYRLPSTFNIDVTNLDDGRPFKHPLGLRGHIWPPYWYYLTAGNPIPPGGYTPTTWWGYLRSAEQAGMPSHVQYPRGSSIRLDPAGIPGGGGTGGGTNTAFAVGGADGTVRLVDSASGTPTATFRPLDAAGRPYTGIVGVALGDATGDGVDDLFVAAASPVGEKGLDASKAGKVFVYDGAALAAGTLPSDPLRTIIPFATSDGPETRSGALPANTPYTNGLNIALADVNGDGVPDLIAGTRGGNGTVGRWEYGRLAVVGGADGGGAIGGVTRPFGDGYAKGVVIAALDADGDGRSEVAVTRGGPVVPTNPNKSNKLKVFRFAGGALSELDLTGGKGPLAPFPDLERDGRLAAIDTDGDGRQELIFSALDRTDPADTRVRVVALAINPVEEAGVPATRVVSRDDKGQPGWYLIDSRVADHALGTASAGATPVLVVAVDGQNHDRVAYLAPLTGVELDGGFDLPFATGGITLVRD